MLGIESLIEHFRVVFLSSIPATFSGNALLKVYLYMKKYNGIAPKIGDMAFSFDGFDLWVTGLNGKWVELKLISKIPRLKSNWLLMHNGERFSDNRCYRKMCEFEPLLEKELSKRVIKNLDYLFEEGKRIKNIKLKKAIKKYS